MEAWEGFDAEAMGERALGKSDKRCPVCENTHWITGEGGVIHSFREGGDVVLSKGYPAVVLICGNCGFIRLHSLDLLKSQTDPKMN
jgi:hypothetical protein